MRKATGIMIEVSDSRTGTVTGRITCEQFRTFMGVRNAFIAALVKQFNDGKAACGEPERVREVIV